MGRVFLGLSSDKQPVAVKVIRSDLAADREFRTRFREEVAAARKVSGRFTALVVDADLDGPVPWLATAYVAGPSLAAVVNRHGPLPVAQVLWLAAGLAEGLAAIHAAGVVHRDLKPSNILLAEDGPRVIDFGIAQAAWATAMQGAEFGSPRFMSPEHALGQVTGPPSDIFSLGAVLTFAATGEGPFGSGSSAALIYRLVNSPPLLGPLPAELRKLVGSCLAKHPGDRPTVSGLLADVGAIQRESGCLPQPVAGAFAEGQQTVGTAGSEDEVKVPALAGVSSGAGRSSGEPGLGSPGRDARRRVARSLPLFVPGLLAAAATAVYLLSGAGDPSPATLTQPHAGTATPPTAQARPQGTGAAAGPGPASRVTATVSPSARHDRIGASIIQGTPVSAFVSPSAFASVILAPPPSSESAAPGRSPSSSRSSGKASPSPSSSGSGSPSPSPSASSSSTSPAPSSSAPSTPATSTPGTAGSSAASAALPPRVARAGSPTRAQPRAAAAALDAERAVVADTTARSA
jgi:Protein kinase domain